MPEPILDDFPSNFDDFSIDDLVPERGLKTGSVTIDYHVTGVAPLELSDPFMKFQKGDHTWNTFIDLIAKLNSSEEAKTAIPETVMVSIHSIASSDGRIVNKQEDIDGQTRLVPVLIEQYLTPEFGQQLLYVLNRNPLTDEAVQHDVQEILSQYRDDVRYQADSVSLNGRLLPIPDKWTIIVGSENWRGFRKHNLLTGEQHDVLAVPDKTSSHLEEKLNTVALVFSPQVAFDRPDDLVDYESPIKTPYRHTYLKDWIMELSSDQYSDQYTELFTMTERHLTSQYYVLSELISFIKWCEQDAQTKPIAQTLINQYIDYVAAEYANLCIPPAPDYPTAVDSLAGKSIPRFEHPAQNGRATGHVPIADHVNIIEKTTDTHPRSAEQLQQEVWDFLCEPLRQYSESYDDELEERFDQLMERESLARKEPTRDQREQVKLEAFLSTVKKGEEVELRPQEDDETAIVLKGENIDLYLNQSKRPYVFYSEGDGKSKDTSMSIIGGTDFYVAARLLYRLSQREHSPIYFVWGETPYEISPTGMINANDPDSHDGLVSMGNDILQGIREIDNKE